MGQLQRLASVLGLVLAVAPTAMAQSTRDEWLTLRDRKQARQALGIQATVTGSLSVVSVRFFSDAEGRLVGVGEARNDHSTPLAYSRLEFAFYDGGGSLIGAELTYVLGGANALIPSHGHLETVLQPGVTGFFKVWASIPASAMSSYTVTSAGEALPFTAPIAATGPITPAHPSTPWSPLVYASSGMRVSAQRVSGGVINDDPITPFCPCGYDSTLAYAVRVSVAAYQDGVIADVQTRLVEGPTPVTPCGEPATTGIRLHESAGFTIDVERPANSIGRHSVEWQEVGAAPSGVAIPQQGGTATFRAAATCPATPTTTVPWIDVIENGLADRKAGTITVGGGENTSVQPRAGMIMLPGGVAVRVAQPGVCQPTLSPEALFFGSGITTRSSAQVTVSRGCFWIATSNVPWLRLNGTGRSDSNENLSFSVVEPNLTGATRIGTVSVGAATLTVYQTPGSRNADFNLDGFADLLWQHQTDGRIGVWLMRGQHLNDARSLHPAQVADTGWKIVGAGDLDHTGSADLVWQHASDGRLAYWEMGGQARWNALSMSPSSVADLNWKIRSVADFNADGYPDLVWQHETTGALGLWFMRANGSTPTMVAGVSLGPGTVADLNWQIVGSGDFNRDGWQDLAWQHQGDGRLAVWTMRGATLVSADSMSPGRLFNLDWKIRGVGDINGDDWPDLIWQHRVTGDIAAWLLNGRTMMAGVPIARVADTNWHIVGPR